MSDLYSRILAYIESQGTYGATDDEIERETKALYNTVRNNRRKLADRRLIKDSGKKRYFLGSGRQGIVWVRA